MLQIFSISISHGSHHLRNTISILNFNFPTSPTLSHSPMPPPPPPRPPQQRSAGLKKMKTVVCLAALKIHVPIDLHNVNFNLSNIRTVILTGSRTIASQISTRGYT